LKKAWPGLSPGIGNIISAESVRSEVENPTPYDPTAFCATEDTEDTEVKTCDQ